MEAITLKVGSSTDPKKLAGSLTSLWKEGRGDVIIRTIGAGALNQATKGVIIAGTQLAARGVKVTVAPYFQQLEEITAIEQQVIFSRI